MAATVEVAAGSAQTVVSGFGEDPDTAKAYAIDTTPIDPNTAKVAVWNATDTPVDVTVGDDASVEVQPGEGIPVREVPAGTPITIDIGGVVRDIAASADSYTDVFAVNDGVTPAIALSVVPKMTDLIAQIGPLAGDVVVPDVVGQAEADANAAITGAGLVAVKTEAPSDTVAAGSVISQDPAAGEIVAPDSTVDIVVSTGPDTPATVPVPDVTGQASTDAQATLEAAGFVVTTSEQPSAEVEEGLVIGTNPAAGTEVAPATTVTIAVSTGAEDVIVPDFTGMTIDEGAAAAEAAGLTITFEEDPDDPDPDGVVVSQDPAPGTTVAGGSEVVAQLSPDVGDPWAILTLDPKRLMTITGINFLPGSTVNLSVVGTDKTATAAVEDDGVWVARFDLSDVQNETELLLVRGTAADTTDYEATFKIPAAGQSTDQPTDEVAPAEDAGFPVWAWILLGLGLIAIVLLIVRMVTGGSDGDTDTETHDAS